MRGWEVGREGYDRYVVTPYFRRGVGTGRCVGGEMASGRS